MRVYLAITGREHDLKGGRQLSVRGTQVGIGRWRCTHSSTAGLRFPTNNLVDCTVAGLADRSAAFSGAGGSSVGLER
jgi:hypothetical protein